MELVKRGRKEELGPLREDYLDSLLEPVELYLEVLMKDATPYVVTSEDREMAYAVADDNGVLYEFHVLHENLPCTTEIFRKVLKDLSIRKAYCQSFDHLHLSMCMIHSRGRRVIGYCFRERRKLKAPKPEAEIRERTAVIEDLDLVRKHREEIFDDNEVEDIPFYINKGSIRIFETTNGDFLGYGLINRTVPGRDWFDIGMYVHPDHRRKGYGTYILHRMMNICDRNGWRPVAGCAIENELSRRTLEKAGLISRYVMLEFEF
jgi:GNAT superfamily N-acetyltransferase